MEKESVADTNELQPVTWLTARPLDAESFAPFGSVLQAGARQEDVNQGTSVKYPDLCRLEVDRGAQAALHLFRPQPLELPLRLRLLERHPLSSQVFMPLAAARFLVVVADVGRGSSGEQMTPEAPHLTAFLSDGRQGIQFARGVWHHPLLALDVADFLVIDRHCPTPEDAARNLQEHDIRAWNCWLRLAP